MSAILAIWRRNGRSARDEGERMLGALRPHGTENQVLWCDGPVALGRVLFRTLPEDVHDRQPVVLAGGRYRLVADIRLDNRDELAAALDLPPSTCVGMADSALLGRVWERWKLDCLDRLVGDFAFIVWDSIDHRLFAVRDHVGQRPLVYFSGPDFVAIASMPKGLLALPDVPKAVDLDRLASHLAVEPLDEDEPIYNSRTFHKGISRVPPGHMLSISESGESLQRYWTVEPRQTLRYKRDDEYVDHANQIFETAVRVRLRRIGAIGSHLSSGLDSSSVTVTAARLLAAQDERMFAFTAVPRDGPHAVAPEGRNPDEGPLAAEIARTWPNIDHVLVRHPSHSPLQPAGPLTFASEMPVSNLFNLLWLDEINLAARSRHIRVMLDGVSGNFTLSYEGLERLPILLWQGRWREWMQEISARSAAQRVPAWRALAGQIVLALPPAGQHFLRRISGRDIDRPLHHSALSPALAVRFTGTRRLPYTWVAPADRRAPSALLARRLSLLTGRMDNGLFAAGQVARHGIETRTPTSDKRLIDFCLALPLDQFYRDGQPRQLVRRMMRDRLPAEILAQRRRGYQGAGWLDNLRLSEGQPLELIKSMRGSTAGRALLDIDRLEHLAQTVPRDGEANPSVIWAYRTVLLSGLSAAQFIRHVEGGNA